MTDASPNRRLQRGAYFLPSLFTFGNIMLGCYAVVRGLRGDFELAAILVAGAAVLDALDGRVARLTNTGTAFGRELDSLADVLTFGAVPALLAYLWGLSELGRIGWIAPLFYLVCCASRLARYNVNVRQGDRRHFVGLPAPAAGCAVAALILFAPNHDWKPWGMALLLVSMIAIGGLMVSTFRYLSFGSLHLGQRISYRAATFLAALALGLVIEPKAALLASAVVYTCYAPLGWAIARLKGRRSRPRAAEDTSQA